MAVTVLMAMGAAKGQGARYEANWDSLDRRPLPAWYDEAKFGIFIHWGVYSVPAWGPKGQYAEWYWNSMQDRKGATWKFHVQTFGEKWQYQDFAPLFKAELFNPEGWADIFARSGARYVVLTSKHHEGFCLWPSSQAWNWNSVDVGPHRDLVGELAAAVRGKGLKMGLYYSLYEWFNPTYRSDVSRYVADHMLPQLKDVVTRYHPSLVFADGEWDHPSETWRSAEFLAWLYNESPVKEEVVVDDRWGKETRSHHGGYYTTEYGQVGGGEKLAARRKWEECRGIGASFGYNRNEDAGDYKSAGDLVHLLVETVSKGGNLLLDIGPTSDGRIPPIMQERLLEIGDWLKVNGEAIYGTHPWKRSHEGNGVWYTAKGNDLYAIYTAWPGSELVIPGVRASGPVSLLGANGPLTTRTESGSLHIQIPPIAPDQLPCRHAWVIKITGAGG